MDLISRDEIENWANRQDAKGNFPLFISMLVRASTPLSTFMEFPSGSATFVGGWDGIVKSDEKTSYVPKGISLWEFGTTESNNQKAEEDYQKRSKDPLGYNPKDCIFIFATPTFWKDKDSWRLEKQKEGIWADVLAYDSRNLKEWLDIATAVSRWFVKFIKSIPSDGILHAEDFWLEFALGPKGELPPECLTAGREIQAQQLLRFLSGPNGLKEVIGSSKDEAIAFIIAAAKQFEPLYKENFFAKGLVIESKDSFRNVSTNRNPLILIPKIDERNILFKGASHGHHILVPLGPEDSTDSKDCIVLPRIDREDLIKALQKIGFSKDEATSYAKESARNIIILKSLLKFQTNKQDWAKTENARDIIPALMLGRWDENKIGDREILEKFSGEKYDTYISKIIKWKTSEVPLFIQIGTSWRLTSPMDAWTHLAKHIVKPDFEKLESVFLDVMRSGNPIIKPLQDNEIFAGFLSKEKTYSSWSRQGLTQSLILVGVYGDNFKSINNQNWVDSVIFKLLNDATGGLWVSINDELPLIAEASPSSFLAALEVSLSKDTKSVMKMFKEEESFFSSTSNHTGLLWALEGLAWDPDYLPQTSLVLIKLSTLDPGGKLSNRPINSLKSIFKVWHFQTFATFDQRFDTLKLLLGIERGTAWKLLIGLIPNQDDTGYFTHRMRWRMFDKSFENIHAGNNVEIAVAKLIDMLLSTCSFSNWEISELLAKSVNLKNYRTKILSFVDANYAKIKPENYLAWNTLRGILNRSRSYPDARWALNEIELRKYEELYFKLEPTDDFGKAGWLFNDSYPAIPEGWVYKRASDDDLRKLIFGKRERILRDLYTKYGIEKIVEFAETVTHPVHLGDTLAYILKDDSEILSLCKLLYSENNLLLFVQAFLFQKSYQNGSAWALKVYERLQEKKNSAGSLLNFLLAVNQTKEIWQFVESTEDEIKKNYWLKFNPKVHPISKDEKIFLTEKLIEHNRFQTALNLVAFELEEIPTPLIVDLLENLATKPSNDKVNVNQYEIGKCFEELDRRNDLNNKILFNLEWYYLPLLAEYGTIRKPKLLVEELTKNPEFFVDVLKLLFISEDPLIQVEEQKNKQPQDKIDLRARYAYELLNSWKKIPGVDDKGNISKEQLWSWINRARDLAKQVGRLKVADMQIAKILAEYPEGSNWPPDEICEVIETINTDSLKNNFNAAIFNKQGSSVRGVFDGGDIERGYATHFLNLAKRIKFKYPQTASILEDLAQGYVHHAKRMDDEAERDKLDY